MKRFAYLAVLMALSSPACARDSYSFTVNGHRVHVEADRHCRSLSCVSISIPGVDNWHNRRDRDDDDVATVREPAPALVPAAAQPAVVQPQARTAPAPAPAVPSPPRMVTVPTVARAQPVPQPAVVQAVRPAPVQIAPIAAPTLAAASPVNKPVETTSATTLVAPETESPVADSPLGDWQTGGKNPTLVHIEACGHALCGYVLDAATRAMGESILVNMKPKGDARWSGNVYSRTSGNSYYGTMTLKQADTLRVEACALGKFLCSANNWTRVQPKPDEVVTTEHARLEPRS